MHRSTVRIPGRPALEADLFLPAQASPSSPVPGVVTGSGFGGVKEMLLPHFGKALADAGIAVLSIDYAGFGGSEGTPRQDLVPEQQIRDLRRGLDWLSQDPRMDAGSLGIFGPSMAGAHTLVIAGIDHRVRAAVSMVPFVQAPKAPPNGALALAMVEDLVHRLRTKPSRCVPVAGLPGSMAVMTTDGALDWIREVSRDAPQFRNEITIRSLARLALYRPIRMMGERPQGPLLTILSKSDTITPAAAAQRALRRVPHEAVEFDGSHFELFGEHLGAVTQLTIGWFKQHFADALDRTP